MMIVIDEMSLVSLVDAEGKIDPVLYPSLAALARDGIWFRNATTVSDYTRWAIPPIVSGRYPEPDLLPHTDHYPATLFTLLSQTHRLVVVETITRLCPRVICRPVFDPLADRWAVVASDLGIVYLHILLPEDLRSRLPPLTSSWARFAAEAAEARAEAEGATPPDSGLDKLQIANNFADWITPGDPQPTFYFFHTLMPHSPWQWLPSGQRNGTRAPVPGDQEMSWSADEWGVTQYYQRHLLQLGLVDRLVGRIVDRLRLAGLYEDSLIVITADHGISFRPNGPRRNFTDASAAEIMRVPLILKLPQGSSAPIPTVDVAGQRVSDRNVETIDIAPTVADVLGLEVTWDADGVSVLASPSAERNAKRMFFNSAHSSRSYDRGGPDLAPAVERKLRLFGGPENVYRVPRPDRFGELVDRPVGELRVTDDGGEVAVDHLSAFGAMNTAAAAVPFDVAGELLDKQDAGVTYVAVAVNGTIRAVTRTWSTDPTRWLATPPLDSWRDGPNELEIFIVDSDASGARLRRTRTSERSSDSLQ
jgi:hypothetical protein